MTTTTIRHAPEVETISIAFNRVNRLDAGTFKHNLALKKLDLANNGYGRNGGFIPQSLFYGNPNLETLSLSTNAIEDLHPDFFNHSTKLFQLDLQNNQLTSFSRTLFAATAISRRQARI